ncbi:DMT family transporter [Desulfovirgula thermocuniculi]|uniref:DMT family transporter n=1 Tax=Desulfovirgula thermocuniculi TaxID=348842 RepID=UPI0005536687|nr:DMT family transporter [Desulfovirgula thermocuniculi]
MKANYAIAVFQAFLAATLFGVSIPLAKVLLGGIGPVPLAALLYLGSSTGLLIIKAGQHLTRPAVIKEAALKRTDVPWLLGALLAGGVAAPILLFFSLEHTPAATASLLLNFEGVATAIIAALIFGEAIGTRTWWAIIAITAGGILLSWDERGAWGFSGAAFGILGSCFLWGLDNNLTRNISAKDPLTIAIFKGLGAGVISLILTNISNSSLPGPSQVLSVMLLGGFSYGLSLVFYVLALRSLGAARTSAIFGLAPFVGAAISLAIFRETPSPFLLWALLAMAIGAFLLLGEEHDHTHLHEALEHEHRHRHDDGHHSHQHDTEVPPGLVHSHWHRHEAIIHSHRHLPDLHHRHNHALASRSRQKQQ